MPNIRQAKKWRAPRMSAKGFPVIVLVSTRHTWRINLSMTSQPLCRNAASATRLLDQVHAVCRRWHLIGDSMSALEISTWYLSQWAVTRKLPFASTWP
jgi:hypothetical protein